MSRKSRKISFLGVGHEVIVEDDPPYFMGEVLHTKVKVRNLKAKPVKRRFCYIFRFLGGASYREMEFDLGPYQEQVRPLYDSRPPYYLAFMGVFQICLLVGEPARKLNEEGKRRITSPPPYDPLFTGFVRDRYTHALLTRTAEATDTIAKASKITLILTITIAILAVAEILTLVLG